MDEENIVVGLVALNGGALVGRTRLQKQAYLLDRCGADFGLEFTYYDYGPYSFDLAAGSYDARAEGRIAVDERPGRHGVRYAIFKSGSEAEVPACLGKLPAEKARVVLNATKCVSDVVLELAATIVFLRDEWDYYGKGTVDAVDETRKRKSLKATDERMVKALDLLHNLGLWERTASAGGEDAGR